jgi:hypothetical protein
MAEHRRVEPRQIVGTGMASDPERFRSVDEEKERRARAWRDPPEKGFGAVLEEAPARGELEDEPAEGQPGRRAPRGRRDPRDEKPPSEAAALSTAALAGSDGDAAQERDGPPTPEVKARTPARSLPRVPPDPRERLLREQLRASARASPSRSTDTPPTGKTRKP